MTENRPFETWSTQFLADIQKIKTWTRNKALGIIGQRFVADGIKHTLWHKGYALNPQLSERSYDLIPQFHADENNVGGIDYYLKLRDRQIYRCYIEVKNWAHYKNISDDMFTTEILLRFTKHDPLRRRIWIVTMNRRNIRCILKRCQDNHIYILPLSEHITPTSYTSAQVLQDAMSDFVGECSKLIDTIVSGEIQPQWLLGRSVNVCNDVVKGMKEKIWKLKNNLGAGWIGSCPRQKD
ncbi:MAG: hypothetical protein PHZ19_05340 [Candidatus Thermoplasmatota archaeon]|nr:hypothetical protein [Candidatus Thermoplasmatota archaeon]